MEIIVAIILSCFVSILIDMAFGGSSNVIDDIYDEINSNELN